MHRKEEHVDQNHQKAYDIRYVGRRTVLGRPGYQYSDSRLWGQQSGFICDETRHD
jgi:hypothetical protein